MHDINCRAKSISYSLNICQKIWGLNISDEKQQFDETFLLFYDIPTIAPLETGRRGTVAVRACVVPDKEWA
jgi:hypothetical protein